MMRKVISFFGFDSMKDLRDFDANSHESGAISDNVSYHY